MNRQVNVKIAREYTGTHVYGDLYDILESTVKIISEQNLYDPVAIQFDGYNDYIELEYVGGNTLRVAYRVRPNETSDGNPSANQADPKSACGYPVAIEAWSNAVLDAVEKFQDDLRSSGEQELAEKFDKELSTLSKHI